MREALAQLARAAGRMLLALALIGAAASGAVLALFTAPVFELLGFHPVAIDYLDGRISRAGLEQMVIMGRTFGRTQIDHFDDVAALLQRLSWVFAASVAIIAAALAFARRLVRPAASLAFVGLALAAVAVVAAYLIYGFLPVGVFFHTVVFPQGNWSFPWHSLIITLYGTDVMLRGALFVIGLGLTILVAAYVATRRMPRRGESGNTASRAERGDAGQRQVEDDRRSALGP